MFFSFFSPSSLHPLFNQHSPTWFMSVGCTYKFFGFSIFYAILNLPLSILYLPFMLLTPCTFSLPCSPLLPAYNPPCDLHFCDSVLVVVSLVCFCFLGSVVDSCEFVVILLFIVLIFFFLDKFL